MMICYQSFLTSLKNESRSLVLSGAIHNISIQSLPDAYFVLSVLFQACHDMLESATWKEKERFIFPCIESSRHLKH